MAYNSYIMTDFLGPAFVLSIDPIVVLSLSKLLSSHTYLPVYVREIKSGLYGPSAYYIASTIIHSFSVFLYPFVILAIGFWMWDYTDDSFNNFIVFSLITVYSSVVSCIFGLCIGIIFENDM
jgi:hypothetical protein